MAFSIFFIHLELFNSVVAYGTKISGYMSETVTIKTERIRIDDGRDLPEKTFCSFGPSPSLPFLSLYTFSQVFVVFRIHFFPKFPSFRSISCFTRWKTPAPD